MNRDFGMISIIMAAYNAEKTIKIAIDSVLKQTYKNWELIVVNDGSIDSTQSIVSDFSQVDNRIKLINNPINSGVCQSRHTGLMVAKGEWIAILDSDDMWEFEKLEKQVELQKVIGEDLIYTGSAFMNNSGERLSWVLHVPEKIGYRKLLKQNLISNSSVLIRKSLFIEYEANGDNMHEDFACWLQILRTGKIAYGIDEPLLVYRLSAKSKSSNKTKSALMCWNTYRYIGLSVIESFIYMIFYCINGMIKYKNLR